MSIAAGTDFYAPTVEQGHLSWLQRLILRRLHPLSMIFDLIGVMWAVYFLWAHNWGAAVAVFLVARAIGVALAWNARLDLLSQTVMGRIALLHLHPVNLALQTMGAAGAIWGLWTHAAVPILGGLSLIFAGHAVGWEKVHKALGREKGAVSR